MNKITNSHRIFWFIALFLTFLTTPIWSGTTPAGTSFTYQGRLDQNGSPANGDFDFVFNLLDGPDPLSANQITSVSVLAIFVSDGLFQAEVDFGMGIFDGTAYWLEIEVRPAGIGGTVSLFPLQKITRVPHAIDSDTLDGIESSAFVAIEGATCVDNQIPKFNGGTWSCGTDDVGEIAAGVIVMWSGSIANIPAGWALCDGTNGTPNLLSRFIKGVSSSGTNPGDTGGSASHNHSTGTLAVPAHNHGGVTLGANGPNIRFDDNSGGSDWDEPAQRIHTHNISSQASVVLSGDTASADSEPEYFSLAFIMKL